MLTQFLGSKVGQRVLIFGVNYFYEGVVVGVDDKCVLLRDVGIVYETGAYDDSSYTKRQNFVAGKDGEAIVMLSAIECVTQLPQKIVK